MVGVVQGVTASENLLREGEVYDLVSEYVEPLVANPYYPAFPAIYEAYVHYSEESSLEYVVVEVVFTSNDYQYYVEIDDYFVFCYENSGKLPVMSYFVVDLKTKTVVPYLDALKINKEKYYAFLTDSDYNKIIRRGDLNRDNVLDIKDATLIQKCIANIEDFWDYNDLITAYIGDDYDQWISRSISDFYRDGKRNIKDATAIQKYIAGLEY